MALEKEQHKAEGQIASICKHALLEAMGKTGQGTVTVTDASMESTSLSQLNSPVIKKNFKSILVKALEWFPCFRNWTHLSSSSERLILPE